MNMQHCNSLFVFVSLSHSPPLKPQRWLRKPLLSTNLLLLQKEISYDFEIWYGVLIDQKNKIGTFKTNIIPPLHPLL